MPRKKKKGIGKDEFFNILDAASEIQKNPTDGSFPSMEELDLFWNSVKDNPKEDDLAYMSYLASDPCDRLGISFRNEEEEEKYGEIVRYANAVLTKFSKKYYK